MSNEFRLPDVGEGLTEAEIVSWHVAAGDTVHLNQVICDIETAKSLVEIPSPFEGVIGELLVDTGVMVPVGTPILRMQGDVVPDSASGGAGAPADADRGSADAPDSADTQAAGGDDADADTSGAVLVGYGTGGAVKSRRRGKPRVQTAASAPGATDHSSSASSGQSAGAPSSEPEPASPRAAEAAQAAFETARPLAKPPVRKLAKDRGIDLATVAGTGPGGVITREDVLGGTSGGSATVKPAASHAAAFSGEGEERIPVKGVRKLVAEAMVESKFSAPHTSVFVDVDATRTMEFVKRLKASKQFEGLRVSPLLIMAKAIVWALARNPEVNSRWADTEIIRHNYVNLGIAAATPRGLVVPNIKDAHTLSLREMAEAVTTLTVRAREGLTQPDEMQHGTITITNVGVFGVDFGLPILNRGEAAIIAMGSITEKPWVVDGEVRPRMVTTVGGSFDHRVLDGDVISTFVADIASVLEEPALLLD